MQFLSYNNSIAYGLHKGILNAALRVSTRDDALGWPSPSDTPRTKLRHTGCI
jgi:hypothetical protein